jgi:hypothetical protein
MSFYPPASLSANSDGATPTWRVNAMPNVLAEL